MKNKILTSLTALCVVLVLVGGFSVTAYAQTPTEETDDSGVIVETEPQPLTPEGNMTLVDDIDGDAAEDKQFIVVKSKGGNYFYIMLPYKTLSFSKIEGRHGTFAFLDKSEDRSRNIRKARPSVRAQLTADKKTAAPKKAAAKRKNHDLEV